MAIYDISEVEKQGTSHTASSETREEAEISNEPSISAPSFCKDRFFSSLTARLFFLILLCADVLWAVYSLILWSVAALLCLATVFKVSSLLEFCSVRWLSVRRSLICGVSLFITLFSPSFGIMIACTYFLMYDKSGIEEVVPSSLQSQFKEFFKS
ncbi:MAG: hypothetical protein K2P51_00455 [Rhabdochlamydiaceae bacterium]|nr:hypothetical protein [Rhabdochlamydiaceae bacterium]